MFTGVRWTETVKAFTCGHMCSHACLQVCVLCECVCVCVCVLQVTAGGSSHQNQPEPILYQAKENNHRYGRKSKELNLFSLWCFVSIHKNMFFSFENVHVDKTRREKKGTRANELLSMHLGDQDTIRSVMTSFLLWQRHTASFQLSSFLLIIKLTHFWLLFICSELTLIAQLNWYRIITTLFWLFSKCCFFFPATRHEMKADWWAGLHFYLASPL